MSDRGKHASRPRNGKHAYADLSATPIADRPNAAYRARHAVVDWVDLSSAQSGVGVGKGTPVRAVLGRIVGARTEEGVNP